MPDSAGVLCCAAQVLADEPHPNLSREQAGDGGKPELFENVEVRFYPKYDDKGDCSNDGDRTTFDHRFNGEYPVQREQSSPDKQCPSYRPLQPQGIDGQPREISQNASSQVCEKPRFALIIDKYGLYTYQWCFARTTEGAGRQRS